MKAILVLCVFCVIGNELIHQLTTGRTHNTLYISFQDWSHRTKYAEYEDFWIDCESEDYRLNVGRYSGNAGWFIPHFNP